MTGNLTLAPLLLVAIIFMWTPPHFWAFVALAQWRLCPRRSADAAGREGQTSYPFPDSALQSGASAAGRVARIPAQNIGGCLYLAAAGGWTGAWFLWEAFATYFFLKKNQDKEPAAHRLFPAYPLLYMTALFAALIVEKLAGLPALAIT